MGTIKNIVIIGNGVSGITAARHIRKLSEHKITVVSYETDYFFSRTALMYVYMGHMTFKDTQPYEASFWKKNRIDLVNARVEKIDPFKKILHTNKGEDIEYDDLILATGSKSNKFGWPGENLKGVQGLYSYQDLLELEENTHVWNAGPSERKVSRAVIVGGGLIGVELAEMLITRNIQVTFLVRENRFWGGVLPEEEGRLISRHLLEHGVDLRLTEELDSILDNGSGRVQAIRTKKGETIECQLVGLTVGVSANIQFLKDSGIEQNRGILVDDNLRTNFENIYAIGDCAELRNPREGRRPMEQVWYTGRMMGETVAQTISGKPTPYRPGHWFNSAKFFDIEYQTYGIVKGTLADGEDHFYWEHSDGKKCMHFVYRKSDQLFLGINVFGIRMRHEVFDRWLNEKRSVDFVIEHLTEANFDPEFYTRYEKEIQSSWDLVKNKTLQNA
jgi:NADPH-dependent 2,4-dienoyl-CoA reductase/sulfur reductase-like enzyme